MIARSTKVVSLKKQDDSSKVKFYFYRYSMLLKKNFIFRKILLQLS